METAFVEGSSEPRFNSAADPPFPSNGVKSLRRSWLLKLYQLMLDRCYIAWKEVEKTPAIKNCIQSWALVHRHMESLAPAAEPGLVSEHIETATADLPVPAPLSGPPGTAVQVAVTGVPSTPNSTIPACSP